MIYFLAAIVLVSLGFFAFRPRKATVPGPLSVLKPGFQLGPLVRITAGGRHGWYETNRGFLVRKPLR